MIEDRNLKADTKLVARYKGKDFTCEVVDTKEGRRYIIEGIVDPATENHTKFKSPSAAGSAVMGGSACNGWRFWSVEGQEPKSRQSKTKKADTADFRRIPGGRAWCNGCAAAFKVEAGTTPTVCPEGHTPGDATDEPEKEAVTA